MTQMRWTARIEFMGYSSKQIKSLAGSGSSVSIYRGYVYDFTTYFSSPPGCCVPP